MPEFTENEITSYMASSSHRRFLITAYSGGLKITGVAYYAADTRTTSRRASDFIHSLSQERLTLSSVKIFERATNQVIDEPGFVVISLPRVDAIYADELEETNPQGA